MDKRRRLSKALTIVPHRTFKAIVELLQPDDEDADEHGASASTWGFGKVAAQAVLRPCFAAFEAVALSPDSGPAVVFHVAQVGRLLSYALNRSGRFRDAFQAAYKPGSVVRLCLYGDGATGGNVLATASSKNLYLFHALVIDTLSPLSETSWLPVACLPKRDLDHVAGGFSAAMAAIIRNFEEQRQRGLEIAGVHYDLRVDCLCGDYETLSGTFAHKSAAALKPCMLCMNVLSKKSSIPENDSEGFFVTIACGDTSRFRPIQQRDLCKTYDDALRDYALASASSRKKVETFIGFALHGSSLLASPCERELLTLNHVVFDSLHNYYSGGVAAQEACSVMRRVKEKFGITVEDIRSSVREVRWRTSSASVRAPAARAMLFEPKFWSSELYKGSATQLWHALPLLAYYLHRLVPAMSELQSLDSLMQIHYELKAFREGRGCPQRLHEAQVAHQEAFQTFYPDEQRPKHHFRMHMPAHYKNHMYVDTWALEAKHQRYKRQLASSLQHLWQDRTGQISSQVSARILHSTVEDLMDPTRDGVAKLLGRIHSAESVKALTGYSCPVSNRCWTGRSELKAGDVLLWSQGGALCYGLCEFFAAYHGGIVMVFEALERVYNEEKLPFAFSLRRTGAKESCMVSDLQHYRNPSWWLQEGETCGTLLCLQ